MYTTFTRHALKARDLFRRWKFKKFLNITKSQYGDKLEVLCGKVFNNCIELILNDVVEKGVIFRFPLHESYILMKKLDGEDLLKAVERGNSLSQVDFLASNFKTYCPIYQKHIYRGTKEFRVLLPTRLKNKLIELVNSGKLY